MESHTHTHTRLCLNWTQVQTRRQNGWFRKFICTKRGMVMRGGQGVKGQVADEPTGAR